MQDKKLVVNISVPVVAIYLLAVTFVLEMRSVWTSIPRFGRVNDLLVIMLVGGALLYLLSRKNYNRHFLNGIITTAVLCAYMFLYYLRDQYIYGMYPRLVLRTILRMCVICLLCFAMREEHKKKMYEALENIIIVIAIVSLVFWVFGSLLGIVHPNGIEYTTWSVNGNEVAINKYYNLYYETQVQNLFGLKVVRNSAIFNESPMSCFMFCFGLLVELFKKEKTDFKKVILLGIAVISTFSTTGYVIMILAVFVRYMLSQSHNQLTAVLRYAAVPVVLIALVLIIEQLLQSKFDTNSGNARLDDFVAGFRAWMDHPLMGNGYSNSTSIMQYMSTSRMNNTGFSNSLLQILAYGGLYLLAPYVGAVAYGTYKIIRRRDWNELAFVMLFTMLFIFTVTSFQMISYFSFFSIV